MEFHEEAYYLYQTQARGLLTSDSLQKQFKKLAIWYGARLRHYLPDSKTARCLDLPCGYGNFLYFLRSRGYKNIKGIDLDANQIKLAKMLSLPVEEGDVFNYLSSDNSAYDCISSLDFIEHLNKDDALRFLELSFLKLKPGGVLILRAPCGDGPFGAHDAWNDLTHKWGMTSNLIRALLEMNGFERVVTLDERPQPTGIIEILRWLVFFPSKVCASAMCIGLGLRPPTIWTRSMICIGFKAHVAFRGQDEKP